MFEQQVQASDRLRQLCSNPLMLSMLISIFMQNDGALPTQRTQIYEQMVRAVVLQVDKVQALLSSSSSTSTSQAQQSTTLRLLKLVAFHCHTGGGSSSERDASTAGMRYFHHADVLQWLSLSVSLEIL